MDLSQVTFVATSDYHYQTGKISACFNWFQTGESHLIEEKLEMLKKETIPAALSDSVLEELIDECTKKSGILKAKEKLAKLCEALEKGKDGEEEQVIEEFMKANAL
ncbi:hypothetical protein QR680_004517 [Steinernema hermaphroditum]|nr:hypothetical protein QR680_004517 [Steinernema hermaphroditum]